MESPSFAIMGNPLKLMTDATIIKVNVPAERNAVCFFTIFIAPFCGLLMELHSTIYIAGNEKSTVFSKNILCNLFIFKKIVNTDRIKKS